MDLNIDRSNWTKVRLGEVVEWYQKDIPNELQSEQKIEYYITASEIDGDEVNITRYKELSDGQKGPTITKHFEKGDLLLSTRSVALRKAAIAPVSGVTGEKLLVLRCAEGGRLNPKLMPFVFQSAHFWHYAQNSASGSVNKFTSWTKLAKYEFLLPPKDQQAELAELLWTMDNTIEKKNKVLDFIQIAAEVFFEEAIERSRGEKVPLAKVLIPKKEKSQAPHFTAKYIGLEHIKPGENQCVEYVDSSNVQAQCNVITRGDLCYSKLRPYLDKAFIADFEAVSTTELLIYDTKGVSKEYVLNHFHSRAFIKYISNKGFGTKMPRVSHKIVGEYQIKLLADENLVLNVMNKFQSTKEKLSKGIEKSKTLQKSIINQIF